MPLGAKLPESGLLNVVRGAGRSCLQTPDTTPSTTVAAIALDRAARPVPAAAHSAVATAEAPATVPTLPRLGEVLRQMLVSGHGGARTSDVLRPVRSGAAVRGLVHERFEAREAQASPTQEEAHAAY
eukprot:scaffold12729_cov114-Isochrysis_galbana.AAC.2